MSNYLQRYRNGEHRNVWLELTGLGEAVRDEPVFQQAMAVAREAISRIESNLKLLYDRLLDCGYEFAYPDKALVVARPETTETIEEVENEIGVLPLSIRAWYETFASVNFEQSEAQLRGQKGPESVQGLGSHPAMCIKSLGAAWRDSEEKTDPGACAQYLEIGPELSNCCMAGVTCPNPVFDEEKFAIDGRKESSFMAFLRDSLEAGGFPFWAHTGGNIPDIICPVKPDYDTLVPRLTAGFRPF